MSHSAISIVTGRPFATVFFGGADRGKVVQIHMNPDQLPITLGLLVEDSDTGFAQPFGEWLRFNCNRPDQKAPGMILFDGGKAEPKVSTVPVTTL